MKSIVTFIGDFTRYIKVYFLKHKDKALEMFSIYKTKVENQLNRKIKRLRLNKGGEYKLYNELYEK